MQHKYFHASNQGHIYIYIYIHPSCTSPPANNTYICPHKVTFHRCLVVGCLFLWQLSYIYKPLNIIEMMSNYITNNKVRLCVHITRLFKDPGCWSILRDSHAANKIVCTRKVKTVQDIALQNKQRGRIAIILSMHLSAGMAVYLIFFSVCYIFFLL